MDHQFFCLNNQFDENNQFLREIFLRTTEITNSLLYLYKQIELNSHYEYEYRLNILKNEFQQERESLKNLFIDQEFVELDNQINLLNFIEHDDALKQLIRFKLDEQRLKEKFAKDMTTLNVNFTMQIKFLKSNLYKVSVNLVL